MQNLVPQFISAFILVLVVEMILTISWSRWYFQTGIPAFQYASKATRQLSTLVTSSDIEKLIWNRKWPMLAAKLNDDSFAIRLKLLALRNMRRAPIMHCVLAIDKGKGMVSVRGYLNWWTILLPVTILGIYASAPRKIPLAVDAITLLFLVGFFALHYFVQTFRLKVLCNSVARV